MKDLITLSHQDALKEIRSAIAGAQFAKRGGCPSVAEREYEFAQRLTTFFWHLDLISEQEWNLIWDNISNMKLNEGMIDERLYTEEVI